LLLNDGAGVAGAATLFKALTYTGNGTTQSITGAGFQPDLTILKRRDAASDWAWFDSTRGATKYISSEASTGVPAETTDVNSLTSFDSDGFSLGNSAVINTNTATYISFNFIKEADVFDVVSYTGTGVAHTEAHALGVTPELIIIKNRSIAGDQNPATDDGDFIVYNKDLNSGTTPEDYFVQFSSPNGETLDTTIFNSTAPTSSVFSVGADAAVNGNTNALIAYLFATKAGFSKVGAYTGTGVSGLEITLDFDPSFVLIKKASGIGSGYIYDSARGDNTHLRIDKINVEGATLNLSLGTNGFTINNADGDLNQSGGRYIYLAMA
jgi:hypothetical protein